MIHEMQRIALEDVPYIIPYYAAGYRGMADRHVHGLVVRRPEPGLDGSERPACSRPSPAASSRMRTGSTIGRAVPPVGARAELPA